MFFTVSKLFGLAAAPMTFLALLLVLGLALSLTRWRRAGRRTLIGASALFILCCFSPLSAILLRGLEDRFPQPAKALPTPTGIIVLGGAINEEISLARGETALNQAATRLTAGVALALRYPSARLVFTGGSSDLRLKDHDEADGVKVLWESLGVPDARMTFEDRSRNTFENAVFTKALLQPKPGETWILVTSAWHMPRSVGIFRRVGFPVVPYPVDYRTFGDRRDFLPTLDALGSMERLEAAGHEWIGLLAYRLTHKTDALLPGP